MMRGDQSKGKDEAHRRAALQAANDLDWWDRNAEWVLLGICLGMLFCVGLLAYSARWPRFLFG